MSLFNKTLFLTILIAILRIANAAAQQDDRLEFLRKAQVAYSEYDYSLAAKYFEKGIPPNSKNATIQYQLGVCYIYMVQPTKGLALIDKAKQLNPSISADSSYYLHIGAAKHLLHQFSEATTAFHIFIKNSNNRMLVDWAQKKIKECNYGKILIVNPVKATLENVSVLNSQREDITNVVSSDESFMLFSSTRIDSAARKNMEDEEYTDIYESKRINGQWTKPINVGSPLNTNYHDICLRFNSKENKLYLYRSKNYDIYVSKKLKKGWSKPKSMGRNVSSYYVESSLYITEDEQTIYFSSDRPGGYGGLDIYKSELGKNGRWGKAINLGPTINTKENEDAPFLSQDGTKLYFSSTGHETMGNYDIFVSKLEEGQWSAPSNIGYPINTAAQDSNFTLSADGKKAYFSSSREGGQGVYDIYVVTMP